MSVINKAVAGSCDQLTRNLRLAESVALSAVDVFESVTALAVPVALAATPGRQQLIERADKVVGAAFGASREAVSSAYERATQAVARVAERVAA